MTNGERDVMTNNTVRLKEKYIDNQTIYRKNVLQKMVSVLRKSLYISVPRQNVPNHLKVVFLIPGYSGLSLAELCHAVETGLLLVNSRLYQ